MRRTARGVWQASTRRDLDSFLSLIALYVYLGSIPPLLEQLFRVLAGCAVLGNIFRCWAPTGHGIVPCALLDHLRIRLGRRHVWTVCSHVPMGMKI
jgi:hypothetical protein